MRERSRREYRTAKGLQAWARHPNFCRIVAIKDLTCLPAALACSRVDALIATDVSPAARTVAEMAGVPLVSLSTGVLRRRDAAIPPEFTPCAYGNTRFGGSRNRLLQRLGALVDLPLLDVINRVRRQASLAPHRHLEETRSPTAAISQMPAGLDFPWPSDPGGCASPGVRRARAGLSLGTGRLRVAALRAAIERVLADASFASAARRTQEACRNGGGIQRAVQIMETVTAGGGVDPNPAE